MRPKQPVPVYPLLAVGGYLLALDGAVKAAQYNTSTANSWVQLDGHDTFSGRNGERILPFARVQAA